MDSKIMIDEVTEMYYLFGYSEGSKDVNFDVLLNGISIGQENVNTMEYLYGSSYGFNLGLMK